MITKKQLEEIAISLKQYTEFPYSLYWEEIKPSNYVNINKKNVMFIGNDKGSGFKEIKCSNFESLKTAPFKFTIVRQLLQFPKRT